MVNVFFELDRLRVHLASKGVDDTTAEAIVNKARSEIQGIFEQQGSQAMEQAVQIGAQRESADFINELRLDAANFQVTTDSGNLDFSEPPKPQLPFLLKNAKPMKDGSGVYKIIPIGKQGTKPSFAKNIVDEQKRISAERIEAAKTRARNIAPVGSQMFRTATSKQDPQTKWVQPAKEKDFTGDVKDINQGLQSTMDDSIRDIIREYMELY